MKKIVCFVILLLLSFISVSYADVLVASITNKQIVAGEPFELHLTYNGTDGNIQPDLSVLQKDFQVYSNGTSVQTSYINGVVNQRRDWTIGLIALKEGKQQIPSIKAGNLSSKSIEIDVLPAGSIVKQNSNAENNVQQNEQVKFKTEFLLDEKNPYIKQEITGTFVIKDYVGLEFAGDPTFVNSDDWIIKILRQPEIEQSADGSRKIKVYFALVPQKSGELEVPVLSWRAFYLSMEQARVSSRGFGFFDMFDDGLPMMNSVQKPVVLQTKPQKIVVKDIPQEYGDAWWIPAKDLHLQSKWSNNGQKFKVGETATREIILSAAGILDNELPGLEFVSPENMKQYPENPQYSLSVYKNDPIAQATYRIVYIPQQAGKIVLPAINLKWFNTETGKIETATVKEETIEVSENPLYENIEKNDTTSVAENKKNTEEKNSEDRLINELKSNNQIGEKSIYLLIIGAFVLGMILSYFLFSLKSNGGVESADISLNKIRKYLKNHDYRRLRDSLIKWGNQNFADANIGNLNDLSSVIEDENFALQMQVLNRILYADTRETLDSSVILAGLKKRLKRKSEGSDTVSPLPKLYD